MSEYTCRPMIANLLYVCMCVHLFTRMCVCVCGLYVCVCCWYCILPKSDELKWVLKEVGGRIFESCDISCKNMPTSNTVSLALFIPHYITFYVFLDEQWSLTSHILLYYVKSVIILHKTCMLYQNNLHKIE